MKKVIIDQLIIEMGRWCTMTCSHCLRGDREDKNNSFDNIKKLLDQIEFINNITFSGGEPFLYSKMIIKTINYIMQNKIPCNSFYIATNGSIINQKLMNTLCKFYIYCAEYNPDCIINFETDEIYFNKVEISKSPWHESIPMENEMFFRLYSFCSTRDENREERYLIPEGRAYENCYGWDNPQSKSEPKKFEYDDNTIDMLYLNSKGKCYPDCDLSYETQDNWDIDTDFMIPDINSTTSLSEQITEYNKHLGD